MNVTVHTAATKGIRAISVDDRDVGYSARIVEKDTWGVYFKGSRIGSTDKVRQIEFIVLGHLKGAAA
jgi:hypothetical protein